jgi:putative copper resistance protein D
VIALLAASRAIHLASLMSIFGASTYAVLLRRAGLPQPPFNATRILLVVAATLACVSGIGWFCLIAGQMSGSWTNSTDPSTLALAAFATRFGRIFVARLAGLAALWCMCALKAPRPLARSILAGLLLASLAPVSHAAAATGGEVAILGAANDALHLLTAGFWIGGLMVLAMLVPQHWGSPKELLGPLRIFSLWGTIVVALLVVTGLINAASILPIPGMFLHSVYFGLLAVKVGFAMTMIALASLNRWRLAPAIRNEQAGSVRNLARSVGLEIALGIAVIGIAGLLGLVSPH